MKKVIFALITATLIMAMALPALAQYPPPVGLPGDIDGDGIPDTEDPDADGDGIPNESDPDADGNGIPDVDQPDTDGDGIIDVLDGTDDRPTGGDAGGEDGTPQPGSPQTTGSGLATTGIDSSVIAIWGVVLIMVGSGLVFVYRRREDAV